MQFDPTFLFIGFTGPIGSGSSFVARLLTEHKPELFYYVKLSDIIRDELVKDGNNNPSVSDMQTKGNELRNSFGGSTLIHRTAEELSKNEYENSVKCIIFDGIKNRSEIDYIRKLPHSLIISVHADREIRKERLVPDIIDNDDLFYEIDKRDENEPEINGQQVKECDSQSDIILLNNEKYLQTHKANKKEFVRKIFDRFIEPALNIRRDSVDHEHRPRKDELGMTAAYAVSSMSTCLKRKVGAVIVDYQISIGAEDDEEISTSFNNIMPYIISTGYNDVPLGSGSCNQKYGKCFRDHLQEKYSKKLKFCPNCGKEFEYNSYCAFCKDTLKEPEKICSKCGNERKVSANCSNCNIDIWEKFIPGAKKSPGKLLDMCRALHAEENAILNLTKRGGNFGRNLVLYVTTQPCNLCANKIVTSGVIKKVVFSEPYPMQEALDVLNNGGVEVIRFEGVKSSAFFKIYQ